MDDQQTVSTPQQRRIAFILLLTGAGVVGMGQTIIFAVLPPIARSIGLHDFQVLSIFMLSAVFWVTIGPLWGRRSDAVGRRPFILTGLIGFALSLTLFAGVIDLGMRGALSGVALYGLLLLTRSIYGILGSATPSSAQAYIADRTPPEARTRGMAAFSASFGFGAMIGPSFAGALAVIGPLAPLYAAALVAAAIAALIYFYLNEKTPPKEKKAPPKLSPLDARIRGFLIYAFATSSAVAIATQFASFFVIDRLGASAETALQTAGVALSSHAAASLFAQLAIVQRFNIAPLTLMRVGPAIVAAGHCVIALSTDLGPLVFGMLLSGLGSGLAQPAFVSGASLAVSKQEQGAVAGLSNSAAAASFIAAPIFGWLIYSQDPRLLFGFTAALSAASGAFALAYRGFRAASHADPAA